MSGNVRRRFAIGTGVKKRKDFSDRKTTQETFLSRESQQNELEQVFFVQKSIILRRKNKSFNP